MDFEVIRVEADLAREPHVPWGDEWHTTERMIGIVEWSGGSAEIEVWNVAGRFEPRALTLHLAQHDHPIRQADLRLPVVAMAEAIGRRALFSSVMTGPIARKLTPIGDTSVVGVPRRRRERVNRDLLERVGRVYTRALKDGSNPTAAVQDEVRLHGEPDPTPRSTASRWIKLARDRGLLDVKWEPREKRT